jgi:pimeloyl-ACP methyl ester carboxylesterase
VTWPIYRLVLRAEVQSRLTWPCSYSSRHRVAVCVEDVAAVADQVPVERFAIRGRSGGAPHAFAVAAGEAFDSLMTDAIPSAASIMMRGNPDRQEEQTCSTSRRFRRDLATETSTTSICGQKQRAKK